MSDEVRVALGRRSACPLRQRGSYPMSWPSAPDQAPYLAAAKGEAVSEEAVGRGPLGAGSPLRTPRAAAIAGIIFSVLLIAALVLLRTSVPAHAAVPGAWLTNPQRRATVAIALNLIPFAGIAFLWFLGVVRDRIGQREDRFFATVFLGSGVLFVAMLFVASAVTAGFLADAALRPERSPTSVRVRPQDWRRRAAYLRDAYGRG